MHQKVQNLPCQRLHLTWTCHTAQCHILFLTPKSLFSLHPSPSRWRRCSMCASLHCSWSCYWWGVGWLNRLQRNGGGRSRSHARWPWRTCPQQEGEEERARARKWRRAQGWPSLKVCGAAALLVVSASDELHVLEPALRFRMLSHGWFGC
jgi:hypothetical protein